MAPRFLNLLEYTLIVCNIRDHGINSLVEPHTLSDWTTDYQSIANQYLDLLDKVRPLLQEYGLKFTVDIPFWYDSRDIVRGGAAARPFHELVCILQCSFNQQIIDRVDRVGVMDYRDFATVRDIQLYVPVMNFEDESKIPSIMKTFVSPVFDMYNEMYERVQNFLGEVDQKNRTDGVVKGAGMFFGAQITDRIAEKEMLYADLVSKEVTVMIETKCEGMEDFITFCALGTKYLEDQMRIVQDTFKNSSAYDRWGIHQIEYWSDMQPTTPIKRECSNLRDVYQWGTEALFEPVIREKTIKFYKDHAVRTVYVDADYALRKNQTALVDYLVLTGEQNLQTEMMFGKSVWARTVNHTNVLSLLDTLFDFLDSHTRKYRR